MYKIVATRDLAVPFWRVSPLFSVEHSCVEVHLVDMECLHLQTCNSFFFHIIDAQKIGESVILLSML